MCVTPQDTQLLLLLSEPLLTAIKAQNQLQLERVLKALKDGSGLQQQSEQIAGRLSDLYYSLKAQLAQAQAQADIATAAVSLGVTSQQLTAIRNDRPMQCPMLLLASSPGQCKCMQNLHQAAWTAIMSCSVPCIHVVSCLLHADAGWPERAAGAQRHAEQAIKQKQPAAVSDAASGAADAAVQ